MTMRLPDAQTRRALLAACSRDPLVQSRALGSLDACVRDTLLHNADLAPGVAARMLLRGLPLSPMQPSARPHHPETINALVEATIEEGSVGFTHALIESRWPSAQQIIEMVASVTPKERPEVLEAAAFALGLPSDALVFISNGKALRSAICDLSKERLRSMSVEPEIEVAIAVARHRPNGDFTTCVNAWRKEAAHGHISYELVAAAVAVLAHAECDYELAAELLEFHATETHYTYVPLVVWLLACHPELHQAVSSTFEYAVAECALVGQDNAMWKSLPDTTRTALLNALPGTMVSGELFTDISDGLLNTLRADRLAAALHIVDVADHVMASLQRQCVDADALAVAVDLVAGGFPGTVGEAVRVAGTFAHTTNSPIKAVSRTSASFVVPPTSFNFTVLGPIPSWYTRRSSAWEHQHP